MIFNILVSIDQKDTTFDRLTRHQSPHSHCLTCFFMYTLYCTKRNVLVHVHVLVLVLLYNVCT